MAAKDQQTNYLVYIHKNKINNKVYVGQTHQSPTQRWGKNGNGYYTSPHFYRAIQKYGWDNFQHIIVKTNLTALDADKLETQLIQQYNATDSNFGYNIRNGGQHGFHYTDKQRQSLSHTLKYNSHNYKTSRKIICKQTGMVFGTISDAGRWANTSHIGDVLNHHRNYAGRNPITGEKLSWEYADENVEITKLCKEKVQTSFPKLENQIKEIICINTGEFFFSLREAANWCGLKDTSNISRCCRGLRQHAGRHPETKEWLKWKYANIEEQEN